MSPPFLHLHLNRIHSFLGLPTCDLSEVTDEELHDRYPNAPHAHTPYPTPLLTCLFCCFRMDSLYSMDGGVWRMHGKYPMPDDVVKMVADAYRPFTRRLERMLGRKIYDWMDV